MDALQLSNILKTNLVNTHFLGVFPANRIPSPAKVFIHAPSCMVVNTDVLGQPGKHWVGVYCEAHDKAVDYFDPFGTAVSISHHILAYLKHFKHVKMNNKKIQASYEVSCGPHVVYFLLKRDRGWTHDKIVNTLHKNRYCDIHVKLFTTHLLV